MYTLHYESVRIYVEFRSKLMQKLIGVLFNDAVKIMVKSFEDRAKNIYG